MTPLEIAIQAFDKAKSVAEESELSDYYRDRYAMRAALLAFADAEPTEEMRDGAYAIGDISDGSGAPFIKTLTLAAKAYIRAGANENTEKSA